MTRPVSRATGEDDILNKYCYRTQKILLIINHVCTELKGKIVLFDPLIELPSDATDPDQSELGSNGNEEVFCIF